MRSPNFRTLAKRSVALSAMKALLACPLAPAMGELKARISGIDFAKSGEMVLALAPLSITNNPADFFPDVSGYKQKMPKVESLS